MVLVGSEKELRLGVNSTDMTSIAGDDEKYSFMCHGLEAFIIDKLTKAQKSTR